MGYFAARSSARLSLSTLTRGSPRTPKVRPVVLFATTPRTVSSATPRVLATRRIWYSAAATLMSGSRPLPDAVTRSTGTGALLSGSASRSALMRSFTASASAGLRGPWFEPDEAMPLYGCGDVADGRLQKYFGSSNGWPISSEPTVLPAAVLRLPLAARGNASWAMPVTRYGYTTPVSSDSITSIRRAGSIGANMIGLLESGQGQRDQQHVDQLDADEWQRDTADAVDQHVPAQHRPGALGAKAYALERQRNERRDDQRVE